jgi:hypothetical protein
LLVTDLFAHAADSALAGFLRTSNSAHSGPRSNITIQSVSSRPECRSA